MQGTAAVSGTFFFVAVKLANNRGPVMAKFFLNRGHIVVNKQRKLGKTKATENRLLSMNLSAK